MSKLKKAMYLLVGLIAFVLGFIGIFLPLLPITSFCLLKSSEKLNEKFMQTKMYEKYVKSFVEKGGMTLKAKLCLTVPVSLLLLFMFITIENTMMRMIIIIMWLAKVIVFTRMKTIKVETNREAYDGQ